MIQLSDGSTWSWKGDYWASGMDIPLDLLVEGDDKHYAKRDEPFRYHDRKPLSADERNALNLDGYWTRLNKRRGTTVDAVNVRT